ncbi:hypothetical protein [Azospirillum sp. SYSU D00513]|uniref:hypothetical protein n=1 Tax=Azospirillum sp. SYSU D00513 TaxID=2812561 RepID=UPI001A95D337|nr:hypothetical protein [Azospirillum sp. SYSU D00513]
MSVAPELLEVSLLAIAGLDLSPGELPGDPPELTDAQARGLAAVVEGSVYRYIPMGNRPMRWIGAHSVLMRRMIATGLVNVADPAPTGRQAVLITNLGRRALERHRGDEILADLDQPGAGARR